MKQRLILVFFVLSAAISFVACNNSNEASSKQDSANTLYDTFPANKAVDSIAIDSNPADATKIDSGNRSTH